MNPLDAIRDVIQKDVGKRGLATDPEANLLTACPNDLAEACRSIVATPNAAIGIVTGFFIPHGHPPCGETDGPLGAVFLARALVPLGIKVVLATDAFCRKALETGIWASGLRKDVPIVTLPPPPAEGSAAIGLDYRQHFADRAGTLTHLIALERVGPSHTPESLRARAGATDALVEQFLHEVSAEHFGRCHTMKGRDITWNMSAAHCLFEIPASGGRQLPGASDGLTTIGIGDGGNEIGMGKIGWDVIRRNIPGGGLVACRVPTDHLIVCGVSNWGAYGLAAGVRLLKKAGPAPELFDPRRERDLLQLMVEQGPLVDGVTGEPEVSVDGLSFEKYVEPLVRLGEICNNAAG